MAFADFIDRMKGLLKGGPPHTYEALPENVSRDEVQRRAQAWADRHKRAVKATLGTMVIVAIAYFVFEFRHKILVKPSCDSAESGFQCEAEISHFWGQYSPFYSVPSEISAAVPDGCEVTFAQVLSRHGARDPTLGKTVIYGALVARIHESVQEYGEPFDFIRHYEYKLGADQLTAFGEQQMVNSGINFYHRYGHLARDATPFIRSAGQKRVVDSAEKWAYGFHQSRAEDKHSKSPDDYPYDIMVIPEGEQYNNTLSDELCTAFEKGPDLGKEAQAVWLDVFAPPITVRLNVNLPGANLSDQDTVHFMELCPYNTVANEKGKLSPFCHLFTTDEWRSYDYHESLGKWYGFGNGNPLAPTRGVGFVNELIARLTGEPVDDRTSTNATLDGDPETFPLGRSLYADFSHDNDMAGIYAAMGLYNATAPLSKTEKAGPRDSAGYSASWSIPFAARMYVEKMTCAADVGEDGEEFVRVLVNDRVIPLQNCGADELGRCRLSRYVESLSFARDGGHWDLCFE
ncbi:hypothetical protein DL770_010133 [Monosporascus sp. CRB-9-2]|nr:hypothetical protein DL770_010133 [Monosporascus sp. CRB-9-2]